MHLVYVVLNAAIGGHTQTAAMTARGLVRRGHDVTFVVGADANARFIEDQGYPVCRVPRTWLGGYGRIMPLLRQLQREGRADRVHMFSRGWAEVAVAAKRLNIPACITLCGGKPGVRRYAIRGMPVVSLSEELRDALAARGDFRAEDVPVIAARVDLDAQSIAPDAARLAAFRRKYGIADDARVLMRIARIHPANAQSMLQGIAATTQLRAEGHPVCFVAIGYSQSDAVLDAITRARDACNAAAGTTAAVLAQDESEEAIQYLPLADIVFGAGRSAFEAMVNHKPVVIVGDRGFAGVVAEETVPAIAYYNFSGRNVPAPLPVEASVGATVAALRTLLGDPAAYAEAATFCRRYAEDHLDVEQAAVRYEAFYAGMADMRHPDDAAIRAHVESPMAYWKERLRASRIGKALARRRARPEADR